MNRFLDFNDPALYGFSSSTYISVDSQLRIDRFIESIRTEPLQSIKHMFDQIRDLNATHSKTHRTALMESALYARIDVVMPFLRCQIDPAFLHSNTRRVALHFACGEGQGMIVSALTGFQCP